LSRNSIGIRSPALDFRANRKLDRTHATGYFNPESGVETNVPGDELLEIGRCFGTTVAAIQQENNLTSTTIIARQTLLIPDAG